MNPVTTGFCVGLQESHGPVCHNNCRLGCVKRAGSLYWAGMYLAESSCRGLLQLSASCNAYLGAVRPVKQACDQGKKRSGRILSRIVYNIRDIFHSKDQRSSDQQALTQVQRCQPHCLGRPYIIQSLAMGYFRKRGREAGNCQR